MSGYFKGRRCRFKYSQCSVKVEGVGLSIIKVGEICLNILNVV